MSLFLDVVRFAAGISPDRTNLVPNPSFEVDASGWSTTNSAIAVSSAWSAAGSKSAALTCTTAGSVELYQLWGTNAPLPVTAGRTYTLSYRYFTNATRQTFCALSWYDAGGTELAGVNGGTVTPTAGQATTLSFTGTAPAGAVKARVFIRVVAAAVNEVFYFDSILVEEAASPGAYFDGSSAGCRWTGTAHASASQTVIDVGGARLSNHSGITLSSGTVTGLATTPAAATDAASKAYTDNVLGGTNVQIFSSSGTWTKPPFARSVAVLVISGGGGGASGTRKSTAGSQYGGGGGAGGTMVFVPSIPASGLPATVPVTVGAGGAGGAAVTVNGTQGNSGADGGASSFGDYVHAWGSGGGFGGDSNSVGGWPGDPSFGGGTGGDGHDADWGDDGYDGLPGWNAGGGGAGGGLSVTTANDGGLGGASTVGPFSWASGGGPGGGNGTAGPSSLTNSGVPGCGGGGGGSNGGGKGGDGGNGGLYGGGGGGGGAAPNGQTSGKGGTGGAGIVIVTSFI